MSLRPARLPTELRVVTWAVVVVAGLVGFTAFVEATEALRPIGPEELAQNASPGADRDTLELLTTVTRVRDESVAGMKDLWLVVHFPEWLVCMAAMGTAVRLLWPFGLPRDRVRRFTGGALIVGGMLRTMDGAMQAVINSRALAALSKLDRPPFNQLDEATAATAGTVSSVLFTLIVVGLLVGLGQYLRSDRARRLLATVEGPPPGVAPRPFG